MYLTPSSITKSVIPSLLSTNKVLANIIRSELLNQGVDKKASESTLLILLSLGMFGAVSIEAFSKARAPMLVNVAGKFI